MVGKVVIISIILLVMFSLPAAAEEVTYKTRSTVYDTGDPSLLPGDHYWDANTFSSFWYQIKPGLSSEVLYIHNSVNSSSTIKVGDRIDEGDLYYISKPQLKRTKIGGFDDSNSFVADGIDLEKYYLMGFFGSMHLAMPEDPASLSTGCNPDEIAKILLEFKSENKKQMFSGEEWELKDGWSLLVQQVDVEGNKVWLELKRDGMLVDSEVISASVDLSKPERTYVYKDDDDRPVFYCYVDSVFRGQDSDFVVLKYVFLRGDIITIGTGDTYDSLEVTGFQVPAGYLNGTDYAGTGTGTVLYAGDDALVMCNKDDIDLVADEDFDLYDGMYLHTEDGSALKMTLWKKCSITIPDCPSNEVVESATIDDAATVSDKNYLNGTDPAETNNPSAKTDAQTTQPSSVVDKDVSRSSADTKDEVTSSMAQSTEKTPGFEAILAVSGLIGVGLLRRR